jgi:hypothetical protein
LIYFLKICLLVVFTTSGLAIFKNVERAEKVLLKHVHRVRLSFERCLRLESIGCDDDVAGSQQVSSVKVRSPEY